MAVVRAINGGLENSSQFFRTAFFNFFFVKKTRGMFLALIKILS